MQYGDISCILHTISHVMYTTHNSYAHVQLMRAGSDEEGVALMLMYSTNRTVRRRTTLSPCICIASPDSTLTYISGTVGRAHQVDLHGTPPQWLPIYT